MSSGSGRAGPLHYAWTDASPAARFTTGRRLMAGLVSALTGAAEVEIIRFCARCGRDDHGAPRVRSHRAVVSVSYADGMVAAAAARAADAEAIGIDIEADGSEARVAQLAPLFAPAPPPDLRGWTLIEAALKADGRGLNVEPSSVGRSPASDSLLGDGERLRLPGRHGPVVAASVAGPAGYVLSVAALLPEAPGSSGAQAAAARPATA